MNPKKIKAEPGGPVAPDSAGAQDEKSPAVNAKKATAQPDAPGAFGPQSENSTAVNAEKQPRGFSRMLLAVCTGVLALVFSAIPALSLWLNDTQLLAQPHERTGQAGALTLTSDDLYLTRILKKYAQRDTMYGYQSASNAPDTMTWTAPTVLRDYLNTLYTSGVLSAEWLDYYIEQVWGRVYNSQDSLGFTNYIAYVEDSEAPDYACYLVGTTVETESQKVTALFLSVDSAVTLPAMDTNAVLAAYRSYLGLDAIEDWEDPTDTWFAGNALYSPRAELMLFCESGAFQTQSYRGYDAFNGSWTDALFDRTYFCLYALSLPEETVRAWQDYARSFPEGTNVWNRFDPYQSEAGPDLAIEWGEGEAWG